jgi:hypothetical protein
MFNIYKPCLMSHSFVGERGLRWRNKFLPLISRFWGWRREILHIFVCNFGRSLAGLCVVRSLRIYTRIIYYTREHLQSGFIYI